ncbi:MAG: TetR/AcrR family transcriptional regulator [Halanaeroarchaeum sp.]
MTNSDAETSRDAIMEATYRVLAEEGYADLTTKAIAEEVGKSTALIHYYYDTKETLLVEFLEYLLDTFREGVERQSGDAPAERLETFLERFVSGPEDPEAFHTAMLDLRTQAPHDAAFREQLRTNDREITDYVADVLAAGIEAGEFREVDPDRVASFLFSALDGARTRWVVTGDDEVLSSAREELRRYLEERVYRDDLESPR